MTDDLLTRMRSASSLGAAIKALDEGADRIELLTRLLRQLAYEDASGIDIDAIRAALGDHHE